MLPARKQELIQELHSIRDKLMDICIELNAPNAGLTPYRTPTPPKPKQPQYRGDLGLVRKALWDCGWFNKSQDILFNDKRRNWSRIKVWFADKVYEATQAEQEALEQALREAFGDRIIKMGFIKTYRDSKSLCIWLKP